MLYSRDDDFDGQRWRDSLDSTKSGADKLTLDMAIELLPETGSTPKNAVIEKLRDKGIGAKKARAFLDEYISASGPVYEWRIKRSGKRDDIHLARHPRSDFEH